MEIPQGQKQFECEHCGAAILVPIDLPPTSAPCPVCQAITTSPALEQQIEAATPDLSPVQNESTAVDQDYDPDENSRGFGLLWGLAALTFLALLAGGVFVFKKFRAGESAKPVPTVSNTTPIEVEDDGVSSGIEKEAREILNNFLTAASIEEKAKYVIGKEKVIPEMRDFYQDGAIKEEELRVDFFSGFELNQSDLERGIYLLDFEYLERFNVRNFFRPITNSRARMGFDEADLLTRSKVMHGNLETKAVRAKVFMKESEGELLIDWHTYVQTKNRLFRNFLDNPVAGGESTFRVILQEHVSSVFEGDPSVRNYRVMDPAHFKEDHAVISLKRDSKVGRLLEKLAWTDVAGRNLNDSSSNSGATVVIRWSNDLTPVLQLSELICWEFLGVGGDPSNLTGN